MSTAETHPSDASGTRTTIGKGKTIAACLLGAVLIAVLGLLAASLMAAQKTEHQRHKVGVAGGECKFESRVPIWITSVAGERFHSFMDYPVIVGVTMAGDKIGNDNLARLPALPDLQSLDLHDSQITSDGLDVLSQWKTLQSLDLRNTPITDITALAELPNLETLHLNFSQVRGKYLAGVAELKHLNVLGAGYIQVTDEDVIRIAECPQLEELSIAASALGEHGLQPLASLQQLNTLVLMDAKYDATDLQTFREARPDVEIVN